MCGIVGYASVGEAPDLDAALDTIAHRGPDGRGVACFPGSGLGLGHARLSIIDLTTAGRQPMHSQCGRFTLSYNGELYNYREHRARLEADGIEFRGNSDTEVLLELLCLEGLECLPRLNGIFAFALIDHEEQSLTLVRDRFGVKPLYFHATEDQVLFASEIKALSALKAEPGEIDAPALCRYLSYLWCPGAGLPTTGFRKLGPGEALTARAGQVEKYWTWHHLPNPECRSTTIESPRRAPAEVRNLLRGAVHRQLVADVPVGAFLSGGLDSSAVVAFAREKKPDIRCFTIEALGDGSEGMDDDLPYARRVADHLGVDLEVVSVSPGEIMEELRRMVYYLDEPLADPAAVNVLFISRQARNQGRKVLLSGAGGDDIFTGYRRHVAVNFQHYWNWMPFWLRRSMASASNKLDKRKPFSRRLAKLLLSMGRNGNDALVSYFLWAGREDVVALLRPELREAVSEIDFAEPMTKWLQKMGPDCNDIERMLALEQRFFLTDHNLAYTDKMSMAESVEVRVPFLDNNLVDYASTLPSRLKQRGRCGKWVLKKAMEPVLPHDVIYRSKTGFGAPLRKWMNDDLASFVDTMLAPSAVERRGLFDSRAVQRLIAEARRGEVDGSYTVFSLLCIELWFQSFFDTEPVEAPAGVDEMFVGGHP